MTKNSTKDVNTSENGVTKGASKLRGLVSEVVSAVTESSKAYAGGLLEIGKTVGGFGREIVADAGRHGRASFQARNLRELGELQIAFAQQRGEVATAHAKELIDLTHAHTQRVYSPLIAVLQPSKAA